MYKDLRLKIYRKFLKFIAWLFFGRTYSYVISQGKLFLVDTVVDIEVKRNDGSIELITEQLRRY